MVGRWLTLAFVFAGLTLGTVLAAGDELHVHFIDVRQRDAILLEAPEGSVLVDAGQYRDARNYLDRKGIYELDLIIATHADADHIGGFLYVLGELAVAEVWYNGQTHTTLTFERFVDAILESDIRYHEPVRGDVHEFGDLVLEVLHPETSAAGQQIAQVRCGPGGPRPDGFSAALQSRRLAQSLYVDWEDAMSTALHSTGEKKIHAPGDSFRIYEWSGGGPPYMHVPYEDDEAWHMLEGTMTFKLADGQVEVGPGQTMHIPARTPHTFYEAHGPTRYLMILTPRLDELISELHRTPLDQHGAVMEKYRSKLLADDT